MLKKRFAFGVILLLTLATSAFAQELKKIRLGYPSLAFTQSHIWVGKEEKLFNKNGVDVDPVFLRGGQVATQALAAGDPPIVNVGTVIQAGLTGFSLVLIAAVENNYYQVVFARPEITRPEQLKGKKFGISGFGSATHYAALILFKHLNLDPNKDVVLVPAGPDAERLGALVAGKLDACFFNLSTAPFARRMGFNELINVADLGVEVQGNGLATSRDYIKSNRPTVKAALKRIHRGDLFHPREQAGGAESFLQVYAHQRPRGAGNLVPELREDDSQAALPDAQGNPVHARHARAADAAGKKRQAGTIRRFELFAGTR
jgi:NitT/TauT family transport system substrate-binding protein